MRTLTAGVTGIALFAAAAVGGVWLLTRDRAEIARHGPPGPGDERAVEGPPPAAPQVAAPVPFTLPPPPTGVIHGPPPVEPPEDSWEAVPVVARASALGPAGGAIGRGLIGLQPRLAACSDEDTQARYGAAARTFVKDPYTPDRHGATVLVLQIETTRGEARIVDAPVQSQGHASDGLIACTQHVLRGQRFTVPQAQPGGRYRLIHPLR